MVHALCISFSLLSVLMGTRLQTESESESESFYSVLLQTQETSAKTYLVAVAEATWKKKYVKVKLVNTSKSVLIYNIARSM